MKRVHVAGLVASLLVASAVGWACARGGDDLASRIAAAVSQGDGAVVDFARLTDFAWDRLHVFPAHTPLARITEELGFAWSSAADYGLHEREEVILLVFVRGGEVVHHVSFRRYDGDFVGSFRRDGYPPEASVFVVSAEEGGFARWTVRRPAAADR